MRAASQVGLSRPLTISLSDLCEKLPSLLPLKSKEQLEELQAALTAGAVDSSVLRASPSCSFPYTPPSKYSPLPFPSSASLPAPHSSPLIPRSPSCSLHLTSPPQLLPSFKSPHSSFSLFPPFATQLSRTPCSLTALCSPLYPTSPQPNPSFTYSPPPPPVRAPPASFRSPSAPSSPALQSRAPPPRPRASGWSGSSNGSLRLYSTEKTSHAHCREWRVSQELSSKLSGLGERRGRW